MDRPGEDCWGTEVVGVKRGTLDHPKTKLLAQLLDVGEAQAIGTLECLFHFTAQYAKRGNIGKWSDREIAAACRWTGDSAKLIESLVSAKWVDVCQTHRLLVHDWPDHADQTVARSEEIRLCGFAELTPAEPSAELAKTSLPNPSLALPKPIQAKPQRGTPPRSAHVTADLLTYPDEMDCPQVRDAMSEWLEYKRKRGQSYKDAAHASVLVKNFHAAYGRDGPAELCAAISKSIANNWAGCFVKDKQSAEKKQRPRIPKLSEP